MNDDTIFTNDDTILGLLAGITLTLFATGLYFHHAGLLWLTLTSALLYSVMWIIHQI